MERPYVVEEKGLNSVIWDLCPQPSLEHHGRSSTQVLFLGKAELGFFHFLEIGCDNLARTFRCRRSCLLKTGFLGHVPKRAESTKEKSRRCFMDVTLMKYKMLCSGILSSSILMFVNSSLCQIVKSRNPLCYFPILPTSLFLFANFTCAKLWSLHCPKFIFPVC